MKKLYIIVLITLTCIFMAQAFAEEFTMSTYYPAPFGVYREFTTTSRTSLATNSLATDANSMVGIGTTNPTDKLTVSAVWDPSDLISLEDDSGTNTERLVLGVSRAGGYGFINRARGLEQTPDLVISNTGEVGIGTTSPGTKLDVNGDITAETNSWGSTGTQTKDDVYWSGATGRWHLRIICPDGYYMVGIAGWQNDNNNDDIDLVGEVICRRL